MFQISTTNIDISLSNDYWGGKKFLFSSVNLFLKWNSVSSSIIQNSIDWREVSLLFVKNLIDSSKEY